MKLQKNWIWYTLGVIVLLLIIFRKNIFGNGNGATSTRTGSGSRSLSRGENMAINKFKRDLAGIGINNESDITASNQGQVQSFVANLNQSFKNIGSDAKAAYYTSASEKRKKCSDLAYQNQCHGYSSFIVCITWGCI